MKKVLFSLILILGLSSFLILTVKAVTTVQLGFVSVRNLESNNNVFSRSSFTDSNNNYYVIGTNSGTTDFDPGPGTDIQTYSGFMSKYDSNDNYLWTINVPSGYGHIDVDSNGDIYFAAGSIVKYNSSGVVQWTKSFPVSTNQTKLDSNGNIYITGAFLGTVDFDPDAGVVNRTSNGSTDMYIVKLDNTGAFQWVNTFGTSLTDSFTDLDIDSSDNLYVTGQFFNSIDFDPGVGTATGTSAGSIDIVIASYDSDGNYLWSNIMGSTGTEYAGYIEIDSNDDIILSGDFFTTVDFDPSAGTFELTGDPNGGVFIAKYDNSGNFINANGLGGGFTIYGEEMAVDSFGDIYIGGGIADYSFQGSSDVVLGTGSEFLTPGTNAESIYISKFNGLDGSYVDTYIVTSDSEYNVTLSVNNLGYIYASGYLTADLDFDDSDGTAIVTDNGFSQMYILKLETLYPTIGQSMRIVLRDSEVAGVSTDTEVWFDTVDVTTNSRIYISYDALHTGGSAITTSDITVTCDVDGADPLSGTTMTGVTVIDSQNGYLELDTGSSLCADFTVVDINGGGGNQLTNPVNAGNYSWSVTVDNNQDGIPEGDGATLAYVVDENDLLVSATVIPVIDLELYEAGVDSLLNGTGANTCELGVLSINTVNTCNYDIGTGTNNTSGVSVYIQSDGELRDESGNTIDACSGTNCDSLGGAGIDAGEEEYGIYISELGGGEYTAAGSFSTQYQAVPTSETLFASSSSTGSGTTVNSITQRMEVTHGVSISTATAQGSYSQLVTFSAFTN